MNFREIIKTPDKFKAVYDFISYKTLKGYPCPFCRSKEIILEKSDYDHCERIIIRIVCKSCRRVENYIQIVCDVKTDQILKIRNVRTVLQVGDDVYLDMTDTIYKLYDSKHKFKLDVPLSLLTIWN